MERTPRARGPVDQPDSYSSPLGAPIRVLWWLLVSTLIIHCGGRAAQPSGTTPAEVDLTAPSPAVAAADEVDALTGATNAPQATSEAIPVGHDDAVSGAPDALVTLVQFMDFQCPFCSRVQPTVARLREEYPAGDLRVVFKHNPLPFHKDALPAARAAQAVQQTAGSEAFFRYSELLFANQRDLTEDNLELWADEVGVDQAAFWNAWESDRAIGKVEADQELARQIGARGTPNFRVNGVEISGAQPYEKFREVIDRELREARALVEMRVPRIEIYGQRVATNHAAPDRDDDAPSAAKRQEDTTIWKVPIGNSPTRGPADALVTIVEFGDYQCPFCKRVQPTLAQLEQQYPGKIRFVFKHNALPFHLRAMPAAMLAIEAYKQKGQAGFWDVHRRLWDSSPALDDTNLEAIAQSAGLNQFRVRQAIGKLLHKPEVEQDIDLAMGTQARGTPHFFINGYRVSGAQPLEKFAEVVDHRLEVAEALVRKGTPRHRVYAEIMKQAKGPPPPETKQVPAPTAASPSRGPAGAPIVVQMFSDYQCPFCNRVLPTIKQLQKDYPWQVRVVWRDLPLAFHQQAPLAAEAAREAFAQRGNTGYWAMHELLFQHQRNPGGLERPALESYAAQIGLNLTRFNTALDQHTHQAAVDADAAIAKAAGISGTPGFVINGYWVSGAQSYRTFKKLVDRALDDHRKGRKP
jgi:protein-disulfide isomerase